MVAPDRERLRRAFRVPEDGGSPAPSVPPGGERALRRFLLARREQFAAASHAVSLPPADELATPHGALWRRLLRYPLAMRHGAVALDGVLALDGDRLAELGRDHGLRHLDVRQCLFLDTETTGLNGGAGTIVFAYGLGFVDGEDLVVEQLFLRNFGEEPAMLHYLAARLAACPVPVTYVGKSFDRHRIAARLAVHRIEAPVLKGLHLDLYHLVRRCYGKSWPDVRLATAERLLVGLERHRDLPGSEAPAAFLSWVRDRTGAVDRVLEHNRLDVLALVALLAALAGARHRPE